MTKSILNATMHKLRFVLLVFAVAGLMHIGVIHASDIGDISYARDPSLPRIHLAISARLRVLEISWANVIDFQNTTVLITNTDIPDDELFIRSETPIAITDDHKYYVVNSDASRSGADFSANVDASERPTRWFRTSNHIPIVYTMSLSADKGWLTTNLLFDYSLLSRIRADTKCYGYWATLLGPEGQRITQTCIRTFPRWMNEMRDHIKSFRLRDLFLVGTHDSGSYRYFFDPLKNETRVSKYTLTQDEDIRDQLMHGVRYLDIRVGNYRKDTADADQFWVNHGISKQQPLDAVLYQVLEFVTQTNEIVIFDIQEFPVGFKNLDTHRQLIYHLHNKLGSALVSPKLTWSTTLADIWRTGANIILSYDHRQMVDEFDEILFQSVQQRWANAQSVDDLKRYLAPSNRGEFTARYERPIADMAEMTPTAWDVFSDKHRGLRRMADRTNREVSSWYTEEWMDTANIVAVDFYRGTTLMELSLLANARRKVGGD